MSFKHLRLHTQFKFIVKNEFVGTYGLATSVVSGFGARTRNVAQHPSTFSTRNTFEQVTPASPQVTSSFTVGILHGVPFPQQVYNITGLVLQLSGAEIPHPRKPRSQVSKHVSLLQFAFCCKIQMTVSISEMQRHSLLFEASLLLHILSTPLFVFNITYAKWIGVCERFTYLFRRFFDLRIYKVLR